MSQVTMQGTVPVFDPDRGWRQWHIREIYTGPTGSGKNVPNIDDAVIDWGSGIKRVVSVDPSTGLSELMDWEFPKSNEFPSEDVLLGVGPGKHSESFRALIDTSTIPHTLAIDSRLKVYGSENTHIKVFKGTNISQSGRVVSAWYNNNGEYVSENIPLELARTEDANNLTIKSPAVGYTTEQLQDGEVVTAVVYNAVGKQTSINKLLVMNSAFIRKSESAQKYVRGISLESPFLSQTEENTLMVPINLPISALTTMGRVHYSNGESLRIPVDGNKMSIYGLSEYVATIRGQKAPLVLSYKLGQNEATDNAESGALKHISVTYWAVTTNVVGAYSVKLFVVPTWIDEFVGWKLEYYLYNLDRGDYLYATPYVEPGSTSRPFDPLLYGVTQHLTVAVDLNRIDARLANYRHVQNFSISLMTNGLNESTPYLIAYTPGQNPEYGSNLKAVVSIHSIGDKFIRIDNDFGSVQDWLDAVYYRTQPLYDRETETKAPMPTHFIVSINGINNEYPLSSWNTDLPSITAGEVGRALVIHWVRKVSGSTLHLGASGLRVLHRHV